MKKRLAVILAVFLCVAMACPASPAEEPETVRSGDWEYRVLEDNTVMITGYAAEDAEKAEIPEELDGRKVAGAEGNPFRNCSRLKAINVSADHPALAVIDGVLFSRTDQRLVCYPCGLTQNDYAVPRGTQAIGEHACSGCIWLIRITIPDSVTEIGQGAFLNSIGLSHIAIPDSVTEIGDYAFRGCYGLTGVTIPGSVKVIGEEAFRECLQLEDITIPEGVTGIGKGAFYDCKGLTGITIPDSVTVIGDDAFFGCDDLTVTVGRDSYAQQYCEENSLEYTYADDR